MTTLTRDDYARADERRRFRDLAAIDGAMDALRAASQIHDRTAARTQYRAQPWKEALDARIDTCPGCDGWRWDRKCRTCKARRRSKG